MNDCIFCQIIKREVPSWKVYETEHAYAFLDIHPATRYHTLVIPKKHYTNMLDISENDLREVMVVVKKVTTLYQEKLGLKNIQYITNAGAEAQQDVFHFHMHIVPRQIGDGQDVRWTTHQEWRDEFDGMLEALNANS